MATTTEREAPPVAPAAVGPLRDTWFPFARKLDRSRFLTPWRMIAAASWGRPSDPQVYGQLQIDMTDVEARLVEVRQRSGLRITMTHLVSWAIAKCLAAHPQANAQVRLGRLVPRDSVDLFVNVALSGGAELSGVLVRDADRMTLPELACAVHSRVAALRRGSDSFGGTFGLMKLLPSPLRRGILRGADFLGNDLRLDLKRLGIPADPFGSAIITSLGMYGVDVGFAPFFPLARAPMILLIGETKERAVVIDGEIVIRRIANLCATFDHRVVDGVLGGKLAKSIRETLAAFGEGRMR